jgi:hypothetical protein
MAFAHSFACMYILSTRSVLHESVTQDTTNTAMADFINILPAFAYSLN